MYFVKSNVKWYKRTKGTYAKQVNVFAQSKFVRDEPVHVIRSQDFEKYFNPELVRKNDAFKKKIKELQKQIDEYANKDESDEIIWSKFKKQIQILIDKNDKLQNEIARLNKDLHDEKDKRIDIQTFNNILMQEINRKNIELNNYQNEVETYASELAESIRTDIVRKYNERTFIQKLKNAEPDNLNDGIDEIIKQHIPTKASGFLEIPLNVDDYDVK